MTVLPLKYIGDNTFRALRDVKDIEPGTVAGWARQEHRSAETHRHYFACIADAWANLREDVAATMPSPEHLRKGAMIQAGYCTMTKLAFKTNAEAIAACAFISALDTYAECGVNGTVAVIRRATSQSMKAMGKEEFQKSKEAVLGVISQLIGAEVKEAA
jgi:hypothetical protein